MKNGGIIEGQISIFELPVVEQIKFKEKIVKEAKVIDVDKLDET